MRDNATYVPLFGAPSLDLAKSCFLWNPNAGLLIERVECEPGDEPYVPYLVYAGVGERAVRLSDDDETWMDLYAQMKVPLCSGTEAAQDVILREPFGWIACNSEKLMRGYERHEAMDILSGLSILRQTAFGDARPHEMDDAALSYYLAIKALIDGLGTFEEIQIDASRRPDLSPYLPLDPRTGLVVDYDDISGGIGFCRANHVQLVGSLKVRDAYFAPDIFSHLEGSCIDCRVTVDHVWRRCEQLAGMADGYSGEALASCLRLSPDKAPISVSGDAKGHPASTRACRHDETSALLAEALRVEGALYDVVTGMTLIPDTSGEEGWLHGFMVAETPLAALLREGEGTPVDAMDYALAHYPAPEAFGGMGFIAEQAGEPVRLTPDVDMAALASLSTSVTRVLEIMGDAPEHRWSLSDPESIANASGIEDRLLFGVADLIRHDVDISKVPDLGRLLDDCDESMRDFVADWNTQEDALEHALARAGLSREQVESRPEGAR